MSDTAFSGDLNAADFAGYYLRIGNNSSPDRIRLYRSTGVGKTYLGEFADSPDFSTGALEDGLNLLVTRDSRGVFELFYSTGFEYDSVPTVSAGTLTNTDFNVADTAYFGVYQHFTTTSDGYRIYLDHVVLPTNAVCNGYAGFSTPETSTNVLGLVPNHKYGYVVKAQNASGSSTNSNVELQKTATISDPSDFTAVTNTAVPSTAIDLSWTRAGMNVMLVRSVDNIFTPPSDTVSYSQGDLIGGDEVIMASAGSDSFGDVALDGNTTYYYKLYSEYYAYYSTGVTANTTTEDNGNPVVNWSFEVAASNNKLNAYGWVYDQPDSTSTNWGDVTRESWRSQSGNYINTFHNWDDGHADPDAGFMQQVALADNDDGRIWAFSLWGSGDATWTASKVEQVVQFLDAGDSVITAFTNGISLGAAATDTFNSNVLYAAEPDAAARINLIVLAEGQGTDGAAQFDDLKLYSHRPETRNSGGGAPGAPAAVYLGDTNLVFTAETWGALTANWGTNWGQARLWIDTDSDVSDGAAGEWSGYINADARSVTSRQFTATGTWYWGIQADYGSPYGTNYWYSFDSSSWTDLAPEGTSSLSVTVNPLGAPTNVTAAAGAGDQYTEIDLTWYKWDDDGNTSEKQVLVVRSDDASFTAPTDGVAYQKDDTIDGDLVIYKGDATSCTDTGLIVDTTYYYALYSENYTYYSVASNASASTASYTPDPPSDIVVTPDGPESLHLSWTKDAGAAFSTFIVRRLGGSPTAPTDGINYTNLQEYGTDTRVVYKGAGESITDMQLLADTSDDYYYAFYTVVDSVDEYSSGSEYATNTMPFYMRGGPIDSFAYWSGGVTSQHGGTNWAGAWTHQNGFAEFTNDNLSTIPNYPPAYGGRVVMNPDSPGESVIQRSLDPVGTGVLYIAYIFRHSAAATDKYAGIALREGVQERLYIGIPGYASVLGLQYTNAAGAFITSNSLFTIHADNDYAIVAKLDFDNHNASIKGYYSDALPGYEPLWDAQITFPVDHIGAIGNLQIKCGNLEADADMGNVYYDELRISTNWQGLVESTNMPVWVGEGSPLRGFGNSTNWYPPYTPQENMSLIFADLEAAVRGEVTNDYGAYTPFRQVWFTENDYDIRIHGNAIKVQEKVENASTNSHEIQTDMSFCGIGGGISEINPTLGNLTIDGFLYIDSNVEVRVWGDNRKTLTFEHSIGEGTDGGNGKFALKGDSIVVFSATNAYAGQTTVEYGDLVITEDKCLGLQPVSTEAAQLTLNEQGTLRANISSPQALHVNRGITLGANGGQIDVVSSSLALAGPVTGSGSLTKLGAGTLVLTNTASDYTGATLVSNGILTVGSDACLGTPPGLATDGQVILYNSTFDMAAGTGSQALNRYRNFALNGTGDVFDIVTTETLNLAGAIKGAADLIKTGGGDLCITNSNNAHTGQYQIYAGRLVFGGETIGSGDVHIHDGGNFYLARVPEKTFDAAHRMYLSGTAYIECGAGNDLTENGIIGGTGSLNKQGDGGLYLMGDNTYSGGTVINGGTVFVDADESLGDTSGSVTVQNWKYLTRLSTPEVKRPKKRTIFALILP
jgi:autotransporter-associated beta strand protein